MGCATPFPGFLHFTIDPYLIMLSVKQGDIKYHFLSIYIYIYIYYLHSPDKSEFQSFPSFLFIYLFY